MAAAYVGARFVNDDFLAGGSAQAAVMTSTPAGTPAPAHIHADKHKTS